MILDTSELFSILGDEPERRSFNEAIEVAENRRMSVATFVETSIVLEARYGAEGSRGSTFFSSVPRSTSCRWISSKPGWRAGRGTASARGATRQR